MLNKNQKTALLIGAILVAISVLCPPWHGISPKGHLFYVGYGAITSPPDYAASVAIGQLSVQIIGIVLLAVAAIFYFRTPPYSN